jgi:hypothetical protein
MAQHDIPQFLRPFVTPAPPPATPADVAGQNVIALEDEMRTIYEGAHAVYTRNLLENSPVILALFTGAGGSFTLYRPGQPPLQAPSVPIAYQVAKSSGHSAMATYQLVAPFLADPENPAWRGPMAAYRMRHQMALDTVNDLDLPEEVRTAITAILSANIAFMDDALASNRLSVQKLEHYARSLKPHLEAAIEFAAETQVSHWMGVMDEWKAMLGDAWEKTYGVTNTLYVTRTNNILFTVLAQYFGRKAFNDRLLLMETTAFTTDPPTLLDLLSRILSDRALGRVFFKDYFLMDVELLSTGGRDAVAQEMAKRVPGSGGAYTTFSAHRKIVEEAKKRGLEPLMPPLAPFHSQEWPWHTHAEEGRGPKTLAEIH